MEAIAHDHSNELEERYFERMASSLGDKLKLLKHLPEAGPQVRLLDVGAGGGELSAYLAQAGYSVSAIDPNPDALSHIRRTAPTVETHELMAHQVHELGEGLFDVVICSSIFHEVFSYGDPEHGAYNFESIAAALASIERVLKPGGLLLLRDGVLPTTWRNQGELRLLRQADRPLVEEYFRLAPFTQGVGPEAIQVRLQEVAPNIFQGNERSLLEFAYTFTWGLEAYPRETQELYALYTLEEYAQVLEAAGLTVEKKYSYLQPGYPEHLLERLELTTYSPLGPVKKDAWFHSNAIWVARKPA